MLLHVSLTDLLVRDYDEAIAFYVDRLGFELREDTPLADGKRWVVVTPPSGRSGLLLARAAGDQSGGRVFLFLETNDFARDHRAFAERGVRFLEEPRQEPDGIVAVFEDLYGNRWDLVEPTLRSDGGNQAAEVGGAAGG